MVRCVAPCHFAARWGRADPQGSGLRARGPALLEGAYVWCAAVVSDNAPWGGWASIQLRGVSPLGRLPSPSPGRLPPWALASFGALPLEDAHGAQATLANRCEPGAKLRPPPLLYHRGWDGPRPIARMAGPSPYGPMGPFLPCVYGARVGRGRTFEVGIGTAQDMLVGPDGLEEQLFGVIVAPDTEVLDQWAEAFMDAAIAGSDPEGGWSPGRSVCVQWTRGGETYYYKADHTSNEYDVEVFLAQPWAKWPRRRELWSRYCQIMRVFTEKVISRYAAHAATLLYEPERAALSSTVSTFLYAEYAHYFYTRHWMSEWMDRCETERLPPPRHTHYALLPPLRG